MDKSMYVIEGQPGYTLFRDYNSDKATDVVLPVRIEDCPASLSASDRLVGNWCIRPDFEGSIECSNRHYKSRGFLDEPSAGL